MRNIKNMKNLINYTVLFENTYDNLIFRSSFLSKLQRYILFIMKYLVSSHFIKMMIIYKIFVLIAFWSIFNFDLFIRFQLLYYVITPFKFLNFFKSWFILELAYLRIIFVFLRKFPYEYKFNSIVKYKERNFL